MVAALPFFQNVVLYLGSNSKVFNAKTNQRGHNYHFKVRQKKNTSENYSSLSQPSTNGSSGNNKTIESDHVNVIYCGKLENPNKYTLYNLKPVLAICYHSLLILSFCKKNNLMHLVLCFHWPSLVNRYVCFYSFCCHRVFERTRTYYNTNDERLRRGLD